MTYRERIYGRYRATHPRAAPLTLSALSYEAVVHGKVFGPMLPTDKNALIFELGCGAGSFVSYLHGAGWTRASGMDQDPDQAAEAARLGIVGVTAGDGVAHLAASPGAYDCVVAIDVLEHCTKDELFGVLDAVRGALKPGGTFVWRAPNADGPFAGRLRYDDLTHELSFTKGSASQAMKAAGFEDVSVRAEEPVVTGARSLARLLLWKLVFKPAARLYLFAESYACGALLGHSLLVRGRRPE